jgi:transglutaminase-like putative cysteine protease
MDTSIITCQQPGYPRRIGRRPALDGVAAHADRFVTHGMLARERVMIHIFSTTDAVGHARPHLPDTGGKMMRIHLGFEMIFDCPQPTPMMFNLNVHFTRVSDLVGRDALVFDPPVPVAAYRDGFGNWCTRIVAPKGRTSVSADALVNDTGVPDVVVPEALQIPVPDLPEETLVFLLGSRYCETDRLSDTAWNLFGQAPTGWGRVQAICDFVHRHLTFGYEHARMTRTALEAFDERIGVCRDFTHLAVTFCRCMNIPARYCTGYLGDIGVPPVDEPMDFSAWFEVFLGGQWHTFDARHNTPRIGRVLIARGRDAADVALSNTFGPATLTSFRVWTDEVPAG